MDLADLSNRFDYHPADTDQRRTDHGNIRRYCLRLATLFNDIVPEGREKSLAVTKLEEAMFWANAGVARAKGADPS